MSLPNKTNLLPDRPGIPPMAAMPEAQTLDPAAIAGAWAHGEIDLVCVLGPTASGKTGYAIGLAKSLGSPVISCDSRQIYKEMSIGTAVPSASQLAEVKHYFIHTKSVTEYYTAGLYEAEALELMDALFAQGHETLVMCGGSMFYIDAVCNSLRHVPTADLSVRAELRRPPPPASAGAPPPAPRTPHLS